MTINNEPILAWFSCGATSAVACKYALALYKNVRIIYIETHSAHQDNERFIQECENWYNTKIERHENHKYKNVLDVISKEKFINSPFGAPCTYHLKKEVRYQIEKDCGSWGGQVWGFDFSKKEINRAIRLQEQNTENKPLFPLIEKQLTKENCLSILIEAGIDLPTMYTLGYKNNNCIGCVKGGIAYWNKIRRDFPETFMKMAEIERKINATCIKDKNGKVFLDSLDPDRGKEEAPLVPECSLMCQIEFENLIDKNVEEVLNGNKSIYIDNNQKPKL